MADVKLPRIIIEISCDRELGLPQQNSLDTLLYWWAVCSPEEFLKLEAAIRHVLTESGFGTFALPTQSAGKTFESLGKNQQLPLCLLPKTT
jgi:hypothetical protein